MGTLLFFRKGGDGGKRIYSEIPHQLDKEEASNTILILMTCNVVQDFEC